jgi:hypothetical protein
MTRDAEVSDIDPLVGPLAAEQMALLWAIVQPIVAAQVHGGQHEWPAWAYIEEMLEAEHPKIDALEVFRSLPTVHGLPGGRHQYGWVWRADNRTTDPTPEERVGLSIAGFHQLHRAGRVPGVADALVQMLGGLARTEKLSAPAGPAGPVTLDVPLAERIEWFTQPRREKPYVFSVSAIGQLMQREYFPILLLDHQTGWELRLGNRWLRKYLDLESAADYLKHVLAASREAASMPDPFPRYRPPTTETPKIVMVSEASMDLEPGWNQPESDVRQLVHLDWIYDAGQLGSRVSLHPLFVGSPFEEETIRTDLRGFDKRGWIELAETYDVESIDCALTTDGARFVEGVRKRRADLAGRRKAARDAFLTWLYNETLAERPVPVIDDFLLTNYSIYLAQRFTADEVMAASKWLHEKGFIRGTAAQGGFIPRPSITAEGESIAESGHSVNDLARPSEAAVPVAHVHVRGNNNIVQAGSPGASASVTVTITDDHRKQVLGIADTIEQALPVLSPEAAGLPAELRAAAASDQHDPGVFKSALVSMASKLATGAGEKVGAAILVAASSLLAHYGIPLP